MEYDVNRIEFVKAQRTYIIKHTYIYIHQTSKIHHINERTYFSNLY